MKTPAPAELARSFSRNVKRFLRRIHFTEAVRRNRLQENPSVCHTHDFCDANELMISAFREHGIEDFSMADEAMCRLWNEAWDMAKKAGFDEKEIKG